LPVLNGCTVEKIIYSNPENLYTVARLSNGEDLITAVFYDRCREGEKLNLTGSWVNHEKYGKQFKATILERSNELTEEDIAAILQNVKGIGPARAKKLIEEYGLKTLEIAKTNPDRFKELGIPERVIENIKLEFAENETVTKLKETLLPLGLTINLVQKVYKYFEDKATDILRRNPYRLTDIKGIGYKKADDIALRLGINPRDDLRVLACVEFVLRKHASMGHVYLTRNELLSAALKEMKEPIPTVKILQSIRNNRNLQEVEDRVYLRYLYLYEEMIAKKLMRLSKTSPLSVKNIDSIIKKIEAQNNITYTPTQIDAIKKAFKHGVSIITGGPGTGKTTITKAIIEIAKKEGMTVQLAAPTGKAAKRMEEVTGHPAKTIHRLLEYKPNGDAEDETTMEFARNELNPIDADLIVIDETSMIDTNLMYHLINAVKSSIVFIGDQNQLPSIGPGTVLADMMKALPTTKLDIIFRQKNTSAIIPNSDRINKGLYPFFNNKDFIFYEYESPDQILEIYKKELKTGDEVQILTPVKRSETGTINLNKLIQDNINPEHPNKPQVVFGDKTFRVGDRVMQHQNNYDKEIFNGDTGIITKIYKDEDEIHTVVDFLGREVEFIDDEVKTLDLSYAMTIHKSQGSQFDTVIIPLTTSHFIMLKRNLIYTAVTRAKKKVIIVGQKKAIAIAVKTLDSSKRNTSLGEFLIKLK